MWLKDICEKKRAHASPVFQGPLLVLGYFPPRGPDQPTCPVTSMPSQPALCRAQELQCLCLPQCLAHRSVKYDRMINILKVIYASNHNNNYGKKNFTENEISITKVKGKFLSLYAHNCNRFHQVQPATNHLPSRSKSFWHCLQQWTLLTSSPPQTSSHVSTACGTSPFS